MQKSITALRALVLAGAASLALAQGELTLRDNAPDRHVVQRGDTLWGIATRFLKDPWRWPELWKMNQSQLRNPHRIYPGDVLVLDRSAPGNVTMRLDTTRVSPRVRIEAREAEPIQTIAPSVIEP